jgi:hypothetical protein
MSDPLVSRIDLRRNIARANGMRFFRNYPELLKVTSVSIITSPDGTSRALIRASGNLREGVDYWKGAYILITTGNWVGRYRKIIASDPVKSTVTTDRIVDMKKLKPGDLFEILDWSPSLVHTAINRAIQDGYRAFPYVTDNTSLVIQEKKLEYDLSKEETLVNTPIWIPTQVWLERASSSIMGISDASGSFSRSQLSDSDANWDVNEHAGKLVSLYSGQGAGQVRTVVSNTATVLTVSGGFDPPPYESKYRLWDPEVQEGEWYRLPAGRFFPEENPEKFYLTTNYPDYYGLRMRIVYITGPVTLDFDSATTRVNSEYIIYKASSILHDMLVSDSTVNRSAHASIAEYYDRLARDVLERHRKVIPPFNMWVESDESGEGYRGEEMWRPW